MDSKEGNDALFLHTAEGILVTDSGGKIVRANPSALKLFGYAWEELEGQRIEMLIPRRFTAAHGEHRRKFASHPHARSMGLGLDLYALRKDGTEFPVEISLSPYENGSASFVIAFIIDITLRKQTEEKLRNYSSDLEKQVKDRTLVYREAIRELRKTKAELDKALQKERELNEMKSRFVSMASHEFRTPLTTILSSLSLLSLYHDREDSANHSKHVLKIENSINNLTDILNDFLSVSRLEEGKIGNMPEAFDLRAFVGDILSEMRPMASGGQELLQEHTGEEQVTLDPKLLRHVLFNLVSNAIKFSPGKKPVKVFSRVSGREIVISVEDRGIGISEADQQHLFERFFRGHNATHIQGTGLGLNIVVSYVSLMNGRVEIESKENEGTTVTVLFPAG